MRRRFPVLVSWVLILAAHPAHAQSIASIAAPDAWTVTNRPTLGVTEQARAWETRRPDLVDTMPVRRIVGLRGAVLGAFLGVGVGMVAVNIGCDVQDCASDPESRSLMIGSVAAGAIVGFLLDHAWYAARRQTGMAASPLPGGWHAQ